MLPPRISNTSCTFGGQIVLVTKPKPLLSIRHRRLCLPELALCLCHSRGPSLLLLIVGRLAGVTCCHADCSHCKRDGARKIFAVQLGSSSTDGSESSVSSSSSG